MHSITSVCLLDRDASFYVFYNWSTCRALRARLGAEHAVAGVTEARRDVSLLRKLVVNSTDEDLLSASRRFALAHLHAGILLLHILNTLLASQDRDDLDLLRLQPPLSQHAEGGNGRATSCNEGCTLAHRQRAFSSRSRRYTRSAVRFVGSFE